MIACSAKTLHEWLNNGEEIDEILIQNKKGQKPLPFFTILFILTLAISVSLNAFVLEPQAYKYRRRN